MKAAAVAPRVDAGLVLAADTIGWIDGGPILKPADEADARRILRTLGGREHELWTGVVLWRRPDDLQICWQERSRVAFAPLTDAEIDAYLATRIWQGCSGAYAIQEKDDPYVRVVEGSVSNVIGLPMETLARMVGRFVGWVERTREDPPARRQLSAPVGLREYARPTLRKRRPTLQLTSL